MHIPSAVSNRLVESEVFFKLNSKQIIKQYQGVVDDATLTGKTLRIPKIVFLSEQGPVHSRSSFEDLTAAIRGFIFAEENFKP